MYVDGKPFLDAIRIETPRAPLAARVTGITVPHHLLAADLIARGFWAASGTKIDRIIVMSPDHFSRANRAFATTRRPFQTVLGPLKTDASAVMSLLHNPDLFEDSDLFRTEHGIQAELPFVAHFFPHAMLIPIAISVASDRADWDRAVQALTPLITPTTLVVQSTDFSHYLPAGIAQQRDQETLNVISAGAFDDIPNLHQSDHMDSKGAQYIQMRLQALMGAPGPIVIANRNSSEYTGLPGNTTSYIVQIFSPAAATFNTAGYSDQQVVYFGGDVLLGRHLIPLLTDPRALPAMLSEITRITHGQPLIINLEGMILKDWPDGVSADAHIMPADLVGPVFKSLNVVAASLANNHSFDLGQVGFEETLSVLRSLHVTPMTHGHIVDLGSFRLLPVNLVSKHQIPGFPAADEHDLGELCEREARPPLLAFVHWGVEYSSVASGEEYGEASQLLDCGIAGVVGAHSHRASQHVEEIRGGMQQMTFSLGNMIFDQNGSIGSGALLELRAFKQGTFATRLIALPNVYDIGRSRFTASTKK